MKSLLSAALLLFAASLATATHESSKLEPIPTVAAATPLDRFLNYPPAATSIPRFIRPKNLPSQLECLLSPAAPLYIDCLHTLSTLPKPDQPEHISNSTICTNPSTADTFNLLDWTVGTAGSCKVVSYHDKGDAHCVPPALVYEALKNIFEHCVKTQKMKDQDGWDGRELQMVQGRWYIDGTTYGRKIPGSRAWIETGKIRP
ncbi:hypothetical protein BJ508DRAFT_60440 [Ascobolus immersus RN42]|uniref:Ecp2 effector protein domain-containing protein n=1 Tax=Ascobolus immersus RN42 TaxID=1160509 RepID=A0A3N4IPW3_ASCIM|nr:hypothetical protein BJ508DRAFT_60440 [Ascobolus immersus RN42]